MKNIGGCAQVTCKYYAIVYKGLEILVGRLGEGVPQLKHSKSIKTIKPNSGQGSYL